MLNDDLNQEQMLRENGLAFFGAITASVSHELNNVISIIDQTAGLLDDLLNGVESGQPIPNERLQRFADRVSNQTQRGVDIIKRLNTFAHGVDDPVCEFEINRLVENLTDLCQRFADMKKVDLKTRFSNEPITIMNSPFLVQQALYLYIRRVLAVSNPDETITVSIDSRESHATLSVECVSRDFGNDGFDVEYYNLLLKRISDTVKIFNDPDRTVIEISIPFEN
ncbi:HAMP domain-containing histidine kinase [bacterium]|nr:HAMP domain-containing histidine kinase [bacterium]